MRNSPFILTILINCTIFCRGFFEGQVLSRGAASVQSALSVAPGMAAEPIDGAEQIGSAWGDDDDILDGDEKPEVTIF